MTDHDDTPSAEERERARAELGLEPDVCTPQLDERVRADRLAARVALLETELHWQAECTKAALESQERLAAELAKLRAAAAPVELPALPDSYFIEGGAAFQRDHRGRERMVAVIDGDRLRLSSPRGELVSVVVAVLRHLLALPPQEDVRGALPEHVSGALVFIYDMFIAADPPDALSKRESDRLVDCAIVLAEHVRGTAPRTEGGGDHGE